MTEITPTKIFKCLLLVNDTELVSEIKQDVPNAKLILVNPTRINTIVMEDPTSGQPTTKIYLGVWMPYATNDEFEIPKGMVLATGDISPPLQHLYEKTVRTYKENAKANEEEAEKRRQASKETPQVDNLSELQKDGKLHYLHTGPKTKQ